MFGFKCWTLPWEVEWGDSFGFSGRRSRSSQELSEAVSPYRPPTASPWNNIIVIIVIVIIVIIIIVIIVHNSNSCNSHNSNSHWMGLYGSPLTASLLKEYLMQLSQKFAKCIFRPSNDARWLSSHLSRSDFIMERNSSKSISPFPSSSISLPIWSTSASDGFSLHWKDLEIDWNQIKVKYFL